MWLKENMKACDVVLIKGSRGVRLERTLVPFKQPA
jgi:hypothetical protein